MTKFLKATLAIAMATAPQALMAQEAAPAATTSAPAEDFRWSGSADANAASELLIKRLELADLEGFGPGPTLAAQAGALRSAAMAGDVNAARSLQDVLDRAYLDYITYLQAPVDWVEYGDRSQIPLRFSRDDNRKLLEHAPSLANLVRQKTTMNLLFEQLRQQAALYGRGLPPEAKAAMTGTFKRLRALPKRDRFVLVDIASQRLWMYEGGQPVDNMKVVVGDNALDQGVDKRTPMIMSTIHYATHNPYWHVPDSLVRKTVGPNIKRQGAAYMKPRGYEVVDRWAVDAAILDPKDIDWSTALSTPGGLKVRQRPGGANSMGDFKFNFPNQTGIYLHDTPLREYFDRDIRTLSNGCIRLEDAERFAGWLYKGQGIPEIAENETHDQLPEGVPVFVTYMTANPIEGQLAYAPDVYGFDGEPEAVEATQAASATAQADEAASL